MINNILVWLNNHGDNNAIIESGLNIKKFNPNCNVKYVYIKDFLRDADNSAYPTYGLDLLTENTKETFDYEGEELKKLVFEKTGEELIYITGKRLKHITEKMEKYDLLILGKEKAFCKINREILSSHIKPLLFIYERPFFLETVGFANNNSNNSNRSILKFLELFPQTKSIRSLSVNLKGHISPELLGSITKNNIKFSQKDYKGDVLGVLRNHNKDTGALIVGALTSSYLYEKLTGDKGLKFISLSQSPLFVY